MARLTQISLGIFLIAAIAGCQAEQPPTLDQAQVAFDQQGFAKARTILLDRIDSGDESAELKILMAKTMLELGDGYAAERYIDQLSDQDLPPVVRAEYKAHSLIIKGKPRLAIKLISQEIEPVAQTATSYALLIWAHQELGTLGENDEIIVKALDQFPENADIHAWTAKFYQSVGNWEFANEGVRRALAIDPKHYEAQLIAGELAIQSGHIEKALERYQTLAATYPLHAVPMANVAGLQLDLGRIADAEKTLSAALTQHPSFDLLIFQKARLQHATGNFVRAAKTLDEMRMRVDDFKPALILAGRVNLMLGNRELATVQLLRASRDKRFTQEAQEILDQAGLI